MTLIIFDCDGVLVDSEILFNMIVAEALTEHGYPIDTDTAIARFTGMSMPSLLAIVEGELGRRLPEDFTAQCRARATTGLPAVRGVAAGVDGGLLRAGDGVCRAGGAGLRETLASCFFVFG